MGENEGQRYKGQAEVEVVLVAEKPRGQEGSRQGAEGEHPPPDDWKRNHSRRLLLFNGLLCFFTLIYAAASICQSRKMTDALVESRKQSVAAKESADAAMAVAEAAATQAAVSRATLEDAERAHVRLTKVEPAGWKSPFSFTAWLRNFGPAPAFEVISRLSYAVGPIPPTFNPTLPTPTPAPRVMAVFGSPSPTLRAVSSSPFGAPALDSATPVSYLFTAALSQPESRALLGGKCALYLWAETKFQDFSGSFRPEQSCIVLYGTADHHESIPCRRDVPPADDGDCQR